jgi:hypothetical protein
MTHMFSPPRPAVDVDPQLPLKLQSQLQYLAQHALDHGHIRAAQVIQQTSALLAEPYVWERAFPATRIEVAPAGDD